MAARPDVVGEARIPRDARVLVSPNITLRMATFWERPDEFDPERFTAPRAEHWHRYAHYAFGSGWHLRLGQRPFDLYSQLIVATILRRFRLADPAIPEPQVVASQRPTVKVETRPLPRDRAFGF
ncbi:hypothetical protein GCM10022255_113010 [Dactylosporangium darangshiense]|uniref:Cytochrome P450 n=1 Tax=Dactylosporangium darangshiense TaxID=579108 RepID=A0ABP8DVP9_9ACTN